MHAHSGHAELSAPLGEGPRGRSFQTASLLTRDTPPTRRHCFEAVQLRVILLPRDIWWCLRIFFCQNWGGTTGIQWVKTKHPTMHRTNYATRNCPAQNIKSTEVAKSCFQERPGGGKPGSCPLLKEHFKNRRKKMTADETFPTIPSGSQSRKTRGRGVTEWLMEGINKNVCLKQKTG